MCNQIFNLQISSLFVVCLFILYKSFLGDSDGKKSACNAEDLGSIPGSRRFPGEGNSTPLQYSCLGNPMDRGAWRATVHGVTKSTWLSNQATTTTALISKCEWDFLFLENNINNSQPKTHLIVNIYLLCQEGHSVQFWVTLLLLLLTAKLLQSCPTLCSPIDGRPPGSPVPGILQARTLEWVAISFSNSGKWKVKVK